MFMNSPDILWPSVIAALAGFLLSSAKATPVSFQLSPSATAVALQFDVQATGAPVALSAPQILGASPHTVQSAVISSGATRYIVYSTTGLPINQAGKIQVTFQSTSPLTSSMVAVTNVLTCDAAGVSGGGASAQPTALPVLASSPLPHRSSQVGAAANLSAPVVDLDGSVSSVDFRIDGTSVGTDISSPFAVPWTPAASGLGALTVWATDNLGKSALLDLGAVRAYSLGEINTFAAFGQIHYGSTSNPAWLGFLADPFSSGVKNGLAYFLGLNPHAPDFARLPAVALEHNGGVWNMVFRFSRPSAISGVSWSVLDSPNLVAWDDVVSPVITETPIGGGLLQVEVRKSLGPTLPAGSFLSLEVTSIP